MMLIDSHSHIYAEEFDGDLPEVILRAKKVGVGKIILPNIDSGSIQRMLDVCNDYEGFCYPLIGLHPTSVNESYQSELQNIEKWLGKEKFYGIGEIGIDLYWDKTYLKEQQAALEYQLDLAINNDLPVVIHVRDSFKETFEVIEGKQKGKLNGIFHCFSGEKNDANKIIDLGFKIGIGGVVTFKNSNLRDVLKEVDIHHLVLETDSPYLAPVPFRGKRNESAYLVQVAETIANVYQIPVDQVAEITTNNVKNLFKI